MNKNHEDKPLPEGAVISNSFGNSRLTRVTQFLPKSPKAKKLTVGALFICVLGIGILLVLVHKGHKEDETPFLKVGKYSYNKAEYDKRISQAAQLKINEADARRALKNAFAARQAADDLKISYPTDQGTLNVEAARYYKVYDPNPTISDYQRDTTYTELIQPFVNFGVHGGYRVGYVEFPFSRYIVEGDASHWHNISLINDDISYAKTQADQYHQQLVKNQHSLTEIAQKVRADNRLTYGQAENRSEVFFADEQGNMYSSESSANAVETSVLKAIKEAQVGKVSDIKTKTWSNSTGLNLPSIQHGNLIDVAYYFILVEAKTSARPTLQADYDKKVQEYSL